MAIHCISVDKRCHGRPRFTLFKGKLKLLVTHPWQHKKKGNTRQLCINTSQQTEQSKGLSVQLTSLGRTFPLNKIIFIITQLWLSKWDDARKYLTQCQEVNVEITTYLLTLFFLTTWKAVWHWVTIDTPAYLLHCVVKQIFPKLKSCN